MVMRCQSPAHRKPRGLDVSCELTRLAPEQLLGVQKGCGNGAKGPRPPGHWDLGAGRGIVLKSFMQSCEAGRKVKGPFLNNCQLFGTN